MQSKHEGVRHRCNQCDYIAMQKSALSVHIQSKHKGIKYKCHQCNNSFSQTSSLNLHIRNLHKNISTLVNVTEKMLLIKNEPDIIKQYFYNLFSYTKVNNLSNIWKQCSYNIFVTY